MPRRVGKIWPGHSPVSVYSSYLGEERKGRKTPANVRFCGKLLPHCIPQGSLLSPPLFFAAKATNANASRNQEDEVNDLRQPALNNKEIKKKIKKRHYVCM